MDSKKPDPDPQAPQQQQQQPQQQPQQPQQPSYTIPGILHYLQYEWHRFEVERQEWEVEKAELSARIALLQGEKKSHENLKHDLIRRIKMLEYCLRMERAKYHKLKHGTDPPPVEGSIEHAQLGDEDSNKDQNDDSLVNSNNNSSTVTYGRELLRHYLREIGYTDTIIDLRSNRVRSLLGIVDNQTSNLQPNNQPTTNSTSEFAAKAPNTSATGNAQTTADSTNANSKSVTSFSETSTSSANNLKSNNNDIKTSLGKIDGIDLDTKWYNMQFNPSSILPDKSPKQPRDVGDAEASVLATFGFLYDREGVKDTNQIEDEVDEISEDAVDAADRAASTSTSEYSYFDKACRNADDAIIMFDSLKLEAEKTTSAANNSGSAEIQKDSKRHNLTQAHSNSSNPKNWCPGPQKTDAVDIGELASLAALGSEASVDDYRRKQWTAKYRLQSHYDCVRALKFSDSILVTASEDETIKLWHLSRNSTTSGKPRQPILPPVVDSPTLDIEPLHTYRGHTSKILSITIFKKRIISGAQNGEIIVWKIVSDLNTADQYDKFDSSLLICKLKAHEDAVWALETIEQPKSEPLLCSGSADLTIKVWNTSDIVEDSKPLKVILVEASPTCIVRMPLYNICQVGADLAVSFSDGQIRLYDIASCLSSPDSDTQPVAIFKCDESYRINSIVMHPTLPYMASAGSKRDIKFWDLKTQKCKSTMVAHLDEVTSIACDPSGKYLLSASHDCSVRLWLFEEKSCIQEITSHRKKFDEGIFAVAFHPSLSHFATAGADGLAKVFV